VHVADLGPIGVFADDCIAADLHQLVVIAFLHALLQALAHQRRDVDIAVDGRHDLAHEGVVARAVPAAARHALEARHRRRRIDRRAGR
jgi:hypothetical protein